MPSPFPIVLPFLFPFRLFSFPFSVCHSGLFDIDGLHNPERHRAKLPLPAGEFGASRMVAVAVPVNVSGNIAGRM